jgi:Na+/melibiose symporter-like transporter
MHVWMIIGGVVVAGVVVLTVVMIPDIVRYMKIKSM